MDVVEPCGVRADRRDRRALRRRPPPAGRRPLDTGTGEDPRRVPGGDPARARRTRYRRRRDPEPLSRRTGTTSRARGMNLDRLLRPRRIAVYGGKWSDYVVEQCMKLGFDGEVWRVHPHREGCFRSTSDLPDAPDSAFLGISNTLTVTEIGHLAARGAGGAVVFASGFGERAGGADLASKLDAAAGAMPYLGPNCYGFANFFDRAALLPDQVTGGPVERAVAIITQSGIISLTLTYQRRWLPVGNLVTIANQQRLTGAVLERSVADEPRVSAIGMYVEGIGDANRFAEAV